MLTVRLTTLDLSRTVVRSQPSVMVEMTAAGKRLMSGMASSNLVGWEVRTRAALRPAMRPFLDLCRVPRWAPDFLTPVSHGSDFEAELGPRLDAGQLPGRVGRLASGDVVALKGLRAAALAFHAVAVAPYWTEITAAVHADRAARASTIVDRGIEQVLQVLSPFLRWESSTLAYECPGGIDLTVEPNGRGVMLVPSYLKDQPSFMDVGEAPIVIGYPIERTRHELTTRTPLADLLGRTRACVLSAVDGCRSTTDVARTVGVSIGSASQHTSVLRSAGLITTHRTGPGVVHALTPLGRSLLQAVQESPAALHR